MRHQDIRFFGGIPTCDSMVDALCVLLKHAGVLTRDQAAKALVLWWNPLHRQHLLGRGKEPDGEVQSVGSIPQIIGRAILSGLVMQSDEGNLSLAGGYASETEMSASIAIDVVKLVM